MEFCSEETWSGWWFGTMEFYDFPYILGIFHHPNWRTHSIIFQRARAQETQSVMVAHHAPWWITTNGAWSQEILGDFFAPVEECFLRYIFLVGHDRSQEVVGYNLQPKNHDLWIFMASLGCTLPMLLVSHCLMIMDVWRLSGRVAFVVSIDFGLLFPIYSIFPMIEKMIVLSPL